MSKYIVDTDDFEPMFKVDSIGVFGIGKSVTDNTEDHSWSRIKSLMYFEELNSDYINEHFGEMQDEAYKRGFEDGKKATFGLVADASNAEYQKGFEDGKAVNDKGCEGCKYEGGTVERNPCFTCCNYYQNYWAAKKQDDEIKVGDEVEISQSDANGIWVVIKVEKHDGYEAYCAINKDGDIYFEEEQDRVTKTGRHFDIASILEAMKA